MKLSTPGGWHQRTLAAGPMSHCRLLSILTAEVPAMSRTLDLAARRAQAVARGVPTATSFFVARAENAEVWDLEGRRYIDFASGIGTLNTGHRHPRILAVVQRQLGCFTHSAFQVAAY